MSNTFSGNNVGEIHYCPQTGGDDSTKFYKIAALVLGCTFCLAMTFGVLSVSRAIRVLAKALHPHPDRTHGNEESGIRNDGGRILGSERASLRRILRKKCGRGWATAMGVATVLAALVSEPPSVNVNLAEVALPAPATASEGHRRA